MTSTKVSVVLPTYEDSRYLPSAINCILAQEYDNIQAIVVDSTGVEWVKNWCHSRNDWEYIYQPPEGPAAARNAGIKMATGDVVAFLDADDLWHEQKLSKQISKYEEGFEFIYTDQFIYDGRKIHKESSIDLPYKNPHEKYFANGSGIPSRTVLVDSDLFNENKFDESMMVREDPELWTRLLAQTEALTRIPVPLATKYRRTDSITDDANRVFEYEKMEIEKLCNRFPALNQYRAQRLAEAKFRYGRAQLRNGNMKEAKEILWDLFPQQWTDYRILACLGVSMLPAGMAKKSLKKLEMYQQRLQKIESWP